MQIEFVIKAEDQASNPINKVNSALSNMDNVAGGAKSAMMSIAGGLAGIAQYAAGQILAQGITAIASSVRGLADEMVNSNAAFEGYETKFSVILGSAAAAQSRIQELAEYNLRTPFEMPSIVTADIQLQNFGGSALATGANLQLMGDMAAAAARPPEEVAMSFGRLYDAIQSGRPFGEAAMRLQEMGLLTGEVRAKLEAMSAEGASSTEIWTYFTSVMTDRVGGMADTLAGTWDGMVSNLNDWMTQSKRIVGEPIFDVLKETLADLLAFLNGPEMTSTIEGFTDLLREGLALAGDLLGNLDIAGSIKSMFASIGDSLKQAAWFVTRLRDELAGLSAGDVMGQLASQIDERKTAMLDALNEVTTAHQDALSNLNSQITDANSQLASDLADIAAGAQEKIADVEKKFADSREQIGEQMADNILNFEEQKADRQERLQEQLTDLNESHAERRADLVEALGEATTDKERAEIQKRLDKEDAAYNKRAAKLEAENAKAETKAQTQHDRAIAKLQERLAKEDAIRAEQVAKIQSEQAAEEAAVQKKHDQLLAGLQTRILSENTAYAEQSATLKAQAEADVADMTTSAQKRAAELGTGPAAGVVSFVKNVIGEVKRTMDMVQPQFDTFKRFWDEQLTPTLVTLQTWWVNEFMPKFTELAGVFRNDLMPALMDFQATMYDIRMSTLAPLWEFFRSYILPILLELGTFIVDVLIFDFKLWASTWNDVLKPALKGVWEFINANVLPILHSIGNVIGAVLNLALRVLAGVWENVLLPALRSVWSFVNANVLPVFREMARVVNDVLGPPLKWLKDTVVQPLVDAFGRMGINVQNIKRWFDDLANSINNIQLPEWLEPGSPTPFELGLRGIQDAMQQLNGIGGLSFAGSMAGGGGAAPAVGGGLSIGQIIFNGQSAPTTKEEAERSASLFLDAIKSRGQF